MHLQCQSQNGKQFVKTLKNDKLKFEMALVGVSRFDSFGHINLPTIQVVVESINVDSLAKLFGRRELIFGLIKSLKNKNRDWYSNAILYAMAKPIAGVKFLFIKSREEWTKSERKKDIAYWKGFKNELDQH